MLCELGRFFGRRAIAPAALLSLLGGAVAGCTSVETRVASASGETGEGISYNLPRGQFTLTVAETQGALTVSLGGPKMVPDQGAPMETRLPRNGSSDDNVTITVASDTNLLQKVEVTSTGRVTQIATTIARTIGMFQGAEDIQRNQIFSTDFYLDDYRDAVARTNAFLRAYYARNCPTGFAASRRRFARELTDAGYSAADANTSVRVRLLACRQLSETGLDAGAGAEIVSLVLEDSGSSGEAPAALPARAVRPNYANCARGVCYRPLRPVQFTLAVGPYRSATETFLLPDTSRLMFVDLSSGLFAEQRYKLEFTDGVLTTYNQNAQSELVGFLKLPTDVLTALIAAPGEALGLRQTALQAETNYMTAVGTNIAGQRTLAETCRTEGNADACPRSAYRIIQVRLAPPTSPASPATSGSPGSANSGNNNVPGGGG